MNKFNPKTTVAFRLAVLILFALALPGLRGGSAEWSGSPSGGDWNASSNWNPTTVPNGSSDVAMFDTSTVTNVSISVNTQVSEIDFASTANAFTVTVPIGESLTISGAGVTNNSAVTQNFITASNNAGAFGEIDFTNNSVCSASVTFTNNGGAAAGVGGSGGTVFFNASSAGNAKFVNNGVSGDNISGGGTFFADKSTASSATFVSNPALQGTSTQGSGFVQFVGNSTAATATFTTNGATVFNAAGGSVAFGGSSTASQATITNNPALILGGGSGTTGFAESATAGQANILNKGGAGTGMGGGETLFFDTATAGSANIANGSGTIDEAIGGLTTFWGNSTAGNAVLVSAGATVSGALGGRTEFNETSTAGNSTLIANGGSNGGAGGQIFFYDSSIGGTARVEVFGNGQLDISNLITFLTPCVTVGSLEGDGQVFLGSNKLKIGSNNANTTVSGTIQDGGDDGGSGGSITKLGTGTLILAGNSTYTGGTTVISGTLSVSNVSGSGTGTGAVQVNGGTLGGTGTIAGAVTVGTGSGTGALISPGNSPGTLTIQDALTLNSDATYQFELNSTTAVADKIVANGVTISEATFSFTDLGAAHLALGTTFVVIENTSNTAISGLFANLADNSVFTNEGNTYRASYEGGTGNDLTITVIPEPPTWQLVTLSILLTLISTHKKRSDLHLTHLAVNR